MQISELSTLALTAPGSTSSSGEAEPVALPSPYIPLLLAPTGQVPPSLIGVPAAPLASRLDVSEPMSSLADATSALAERLARQLPDGHGITIQVAGEMSPRAFRVGAEARSFIASLPPGRITSIVFYGHGAPGMMALEANMVLGADDVAAMLRDKLAPNAQVQLFGCNTASVGKRSYESNLVEMSFFGWSSLVRRIMYYTVPVIAGGASKAEMKRAWNEDMAAETSRLLPGARVSGFRTFAFPADRLKPGSTNATPSRHLVARSATYVDGRAIK